MTPSITRQVSPEEERIAELEAENERLKCCGNCGSWYGTKGSCIGSVADPCHFIPSRWAERITP